MKTFKEYLNSLQEQGFMRIQAGGQTIEKRGGQTIRDTTRGIDNRPTATPSVARPTATPSVPPPATIRNTSTTTRTSSPASSSTTTTQTSNQRLRQAQQSAAEVGKATGTSGLMNRTTGVSNRIQGYYDRLRNTMRQTGVGGSGANQNMNLRGVPMKNSYEPQGELIEQEATYNQRIGRDPSVPSHLFGGNASVRGSLERRFRSLSRQDRRSFKGGGGYARMNNSGDTMSQVVKRGEKEQERLSSKMVNTANWTDNQGRKVYAGNPPMRFNVKNSYELEGEQLQEKSLSKAQQRFFGMVRATQKGEMKAPSPEVAKAASSMKKGDVKDFAKTKHKGLPEKKEVKESSEDKKRDKRQERGGVGANVDYKKPPSKKSSNAELGIKPMTDEQREKRKKEMIAHLKKMRGR